MSKRITLNEARQDALYGVIHSVITQYRLECFQNKGPLRSLTHLGLTKLDKGLEDLEKRLCGAVYDHINEEWLSNG